MQENGTEIGKKWMDLDVFGKSTVGFGDDLVIRHWKVF